MIPAVHCKKKKITSENIQHCICASKIIHSVCLSTVMQKCFHNLYHHQSETQLWEHEQRRAIEHKLHYSLEAAASSKHKGRKERKQIWPVRGLPLLRKHSSHRLAWHRRWLSWLRRNCTGKGFTPQATERTRRVQLLLTKHDQRWL